MPRTPDPVLYQRNALAPGLIAAAILFAAPALVAIGWMPVVLYGAAILGLIVAWYAFQARQWWWSIVFVGVAIAWNPVFPFVVEGVGWNIAHAAAAVAFLVAGALIKVPREAPARR